MKVIKVMMIVLLVLVFLLGLGIYIALKTFDINKYRSHITRELSGMLDREVQMEHIALNFSIRQGVLLVIQGFSVNDDPQIAREEILRVKTLKLQVDLMPLLTEKKIHVLSIDVEGPQLHIIRQSDGQTNIQNVMEATVQGKQGEASPSEVPSQTTAKEHAPLGSADVFIDSIRLTDGTFSYTDKALPQPLNLMVTHIEVEVQQFSLQKPFSFKLLASVLNKKQQNVSVSGKAQLHIGTKSVRLDDVLFKTDLKNFSVEEINSFLTAYAPLQLLQQPEGRVEYKIQQMVAGEKGVQALASTGSLVDGKLKISGIPYVLENIDLQFEMNESDLLLREFFFYLTGGKINTKGNIYDLFTQPNYRFEMDIEDIALSSLLSPYSLPFKVEGVIQGSVNGNGKGFDQAQLLSNLAAEGSLEVQGGKITDFNLFKFLMEQLSFIPGLEEKLQSYLTEKYKSKLEQKDTILQKAVSSFKTHEGRLLINESLIEADGVILSTNGEADLEQQTATLNLAVLFEKELSASMTESVPELSGLLDEQGRITFPFKTYQGPLTKIQLYPDLEYVAKRLIQTKGKEELKKAILKALDLEDQPSAEGTPPGSQEGTPNQSGDAQQKQETRPEEILIDNVLDLIFK